MARGSGQLSTRSWAIYIYTHLSAIQNRERRLFLLTTGAQCSENSHSMSRSCVLEHQAGEEVSLRSAVEVTRGSGQLSM